MLLFPILTLGLTTTKGSPREEQVKLMQVNQPTQLLTETPKQPQKEKPKLLRKETPRLRQLGKLLHEVTPRLRRNERQLREKALKLMRVLERALMRNKGTHRRQALSLHQVRHL